LEFLISIRRFARSLTWKTGNGTTDLNRCEEAHSACVLHCKPCRICCTGRLVKSSGTFHDPTC
jgi:hypothetical protein